MRRDGTCPCAPLLREVSDITTCTGNDTDCLYRRYTILVMINTVPLYRCAHVTGFSPSRFVSQSSLAPSPLPSDVVVITTGRLRSVLAPCLTRHFHRNESKDCPKKCGKSVRKACTSASAAALSCLYLPILLKTQATRCQNCSKIQTVCLWKGCACVN